MRRSLILICTLLAVCVGLGLWLDNAQQAVARKYLDHSANIRSLLAKKGAAAAQEEQAYVYARWQQDAKHLNCLIDHHHTRAVTVALGKLSTALSEDWNEEALQALDELDEALREVETSDFPYLENIL